MWPRRGSAAMCQTVTRTPGETKMGKIVNNEYLGGSDPFPHFLWTCLKQYEALSTNHFKKAIVDFLIIDVITPNHSSFILFHQTIHLQHDHNSTQKELPTSFSQESLLTEIKMSRCLIFHLTWFCLSVWCLSRTVLVSYRSWQKLSVLKYAARFLHLFQCDKLWQVWWFEDKMHWMFIKGKLK